MNSPAQIRHSPSERVWALVSGLPRQKRLARTMLMLQAFIDESYDGGVYALCGYITTAEKWSKFSDEWESVRLDSPKIRRFKFSECVKQKGEFYGVSEEAAIAKMSAFYKVIGDNADAFVTAAVNPKLYSDIFGIEKYQKNIRSPYFCLLLTIMARLPPLLKEVGLQGPVEFIFDRQVMQEKKILEVWYWLEKCGLIDRDMVKGSPRFESDDELPPLQAADMIAGRTRLALKEEFGIVPPLAIPRLPEQKKLNGLSFVWRESDLWRLVASMEISERTAIRGTFGWVVGSRPFISRNFSPLLQRS